MVLALEELKAWIKELAYNLIMALKALSLMFSGSLKLQIMKSGLIMLIIDFIQLIRVIIELVMSGIDGFCSDDEQSVKNALEKVYGDTAAVEIASAQMGLTAGSANNVGNSFGGAASGIRITNTQAGFSTAFSLNECAISREPDYKDPIKSIFEAIEQDSILKSATTGA